MMDRLEIHYTERIIDELHIQNYLKMYELGLIRRGTLTNEIRKYKLVEFTFEED